MKTAKKALLLVLCAIALVVASVMGTLAYLQDQTEVVTNTMTVGKVTISLDEADVDEYGVAIDGASRVTANNYKLIPNHTYTKDPILTVNANSENAWIYVKVVNGIEAIEDNENTILDQMVENRWIKLEGVDNVYFQKHATATKAVEYPVFESFKINGEVEGNKPEVPDEDVLYIADFDDETITVQGYAIQMDGFDAEGETDEAIQAAALEAWNAGNFGD